MNLLAIEREARRQRPPQPPEASHGLLAATVARDFECAIRRDLNLDLIAFLECQRVDHGGGKSYRQAVPSLCDVHVPAP